MKRIVWGTVLAAAVLAGCKESAAPAVDPEDVDPKSLYQVEARVSDALAPGGSGTLTLAIRPKPGAEVKAETPLRATLQPRGPVEVGSAELGYDDHKRIEAKGPVFEVPVHAKEAGEGAVDVDLTFFICTAELCMRTKEDLSLDLRIQ